MNTLSPSERDRLLDLLTDRALGVLSHDDAAELGSLLDRAGIGADEAERDTDALVSSLVLADAGTESMPASLRGSLQQRGERMFGDQVAGRISGTTGGSWAGWTVAAAAVLLAAVGWLRPPPTAAIPPERRLAQLEDQPDTVILPFDGMGELAGVDGVGEIVWNARLQEGFLRLSAVPGNDPAQQQYQLWIFDASRDQTYPVDAGVFNVAGEGGPEYLVPFEPKLGVGDAAAFAVTKERAGGVVVTDKSGLVLLAPVPTDG
jgi:hypothetical protein